MTNTPSRIPSPPEKIVNIPNSLTAIRACVVWYVSYLLATKWPGLETGIIYASAMTTDWLDGKLARVLHQETRFGKRLDPIVDSMSFHFPLWALAYESNNGILPSIYLASSWFIALRDADLFRRWLKLEQIGEIFDVSRLGKLKTAIQMSALSILIATPHTREMLQDLGVWMLGMGTSLSLASWVDYYQKLKNRLL